MTRKPTDEDVSSGPRSAIRQEFARRLQKAMLDHKPLPMSQSDLARASNCGKDAVSTYVRGISMPGPKALKQLSDALGLLPEDLVPTGTNIVTSGDALPSFQIRQVGAGEGKVWLIVNQAVTKDQAAKITAVLLGAG